VVLIEFFICFWTIVYEFEGVNLSLNLDYELKTIEEKSSRNGHEWHNFKWRFCVVDSVRRGRESVGSCVCVYFVFCEWKRENKREKRRRKEEEKGRKGKKQEIQFYFSLFFSRFVWNSLKRMYENVHEDEEGKEMKKGIKN